MPTRRDVLGRCGLAVATAGLAGCGNRNAGSSSAGAGARSSGGSVGRSTSGSNGYAATERSVEHLRHAVRASPVVADETLYVATQGSGIYAFDLASGELQWQVETNGATQAPCIVDDVIYAGAFGPGETQSEILSSDGTAYAIDRRSGEIQWETTLRGSPVDTPVVRGETVYYGSLMYGLHALDAATGERRWGVKLGPMGVFNDGVQVGDGLAYAPGRRRIHAVDLASREVSWRTEPTITPLGVTLDGDRLYAGISRGVAALRADTGETVWTAGSSPSTVPTVGSSVFAGTYQEPGVVALDPETGDERWRRGLTADPVRPVVERDALYVATHDGTVRVVDERGSVRSTLQFDGEPDAGTETATRPNELRCRPTLHDGVMYLGDDSGSVAALDTENGRVRWRRSIEDVA